MTLPDPGRGCHRPAATRLERRLAALGTVLLGAFTATPAIAAPSAPAMRGSFVRPALPGSAAGRIVPRAGTLPIDWLETYHDGGHTGYNPKETLLSPSTVPNLQLLAYTGYNAGAMVLDNGSFFSQNLVASNEEAVFAYHGRTLKQLWNVPSGGNFLGSSGSYGGDTMIADKGVVIAECISPPSAAYTTVCAYSQKTGSLVWSFAIPPSSQNKFSGLLTPPSYWNGVVYFAYTLVQGSQSNEVMFVAVAAATGTVLVDRQIGSANSVWYDTPAIGDGQVFYSCFQEVCAYKESTGVSTWTAHTGATQNAMTYADHLLFVHYTGGPSGNQTGVVALDPSTGNVVHSYPYCPNGCRNGTQPVAVAGKTMYVTTPDGRLLAFNVKTGKQLWSAGTTVASSPSVANGVVYVENSDPNSPVATAYDAKTGTALWNAPQNGRTLAPPPVVANGILYIDSTGCGPSQSGGICSYTVP